MEKVYGNLRKPARWRRARAMQLFPRSQEYSTAVLVVLKSTWCSFCLKVQQRRAHDVSQVRRRPIFYTGRRRERSGEVRISENLPTGRNQSTFRDLTRF